MIDRAPQSLEPRTADKTSPRVLLIATAIILLGLAPGCRICGSCEDADYPAYGGVWQRTNRTTGRVGSVFDPAGARGSSLTERSQPTDADAAERDRGPGKSFGSEDPNADQDPDPSVNPERDPLDTELPSLDEMEDENSNRLRDLELDDIEVNLVRPRRRPRA